VSYDPERGALWSEIRRVMRSAQVIERTSVSALVRRLHLLEQPDVFAMEMAPLGRQKVCDEPILLVGGEETALPDRVRPIPDGTLRATSKVY